jgi:3-deoxy-D-manno-octulosonic-acid transferase
MYFLYSAALVLAFVIATPFWLFKMLRHGKYRAGLSERLGRVPERVRSAQPGDVCIWIHAVSVGEVLAVSQLVNQLRDEADGTLRVVVSTTTTTGQKLAQERFGADNVFYLPLDFGFCIRPYMRALRPKLVVMAETEFWPNFLRIAKRCGAQVAVVNARISDRSLPGYRRWRGILSRVLRNVDIFLAQSEEDKRRLVEVGAPEQRVQVSGNLKFDVKPPEKLAIVEQLRDSIARSGGGPVIVAGSTVGWEDKSVLMMFARLLNDFPNAVLVLAPRRPELFDEVFALSQGMSLRTWRRSKTDLAITAVSGGVFLLDTIGELGSLYQLGTCAFVGGSLENSGGHNILEPAGFGVPVIVGPHTHNFRDIVGLFRRADALVELSPGSPAQDTDALYTAALAILKGDAGKLRANIKQVMGSQTGATERTAATLNKLLEAAR